MANGQRRTTNDAFEDIMRIAYLDCFSGISGDMFLAALIDAGVSPKVFEQAVDALRVGARLEISRVNRSGISATKVDVVVNGKKDDARARDVRVERRASTPASAHHHHEHPHDERQSPHGRGLKEIREIIGRTALSE